MISTRTMKLKALGEPAIYLRPVRVKYLKTTKCGCKKIGQVVYMDHITAGFKARRGIVEILN